MQQPFCNRLHWLRCHYSIRVFFQHITSRKSLSIYESSAQTGSIQPCLPTAEENSFLSRKRIKRRSPQLHGFFVRNALVAAVFLSRASFPVWMSPCVFQKSPICEDPIVSPLSTTMKSIALRSVYRERCFSFASFFAPLKELQAHCLRVFFLQRRTIAITAANSADAASGATESDALVSTGFSV